MRSYHRLLIGSTVWRRVRVPLLAALALVVIGAGLWWVQDEFRGGASPEEVAARYLDAMKRGDELAIRWLMHPDHEQLGPVRERVERYGRIASERVTFELVPHSVAGYLVGVRMNLHDESIDEIVVQHLGTGGMRARWFLVAFHETGFLTQVPISEPTVPPRTATPIDFVIPSRCALVGEPVIEADRTEWRFDCGPELNRDARGALRDALTTQGWTTCGPALASETWLKEGLSLRISESSLAPGDYPKFSQRRASTC